MDFRKRGPAAFKPTIRPRAARSATAASTTTPAAAPSSTRDLDKPDATDSSVSASTGVPNIGAPASSILSASPGITESSTETTSRAASQPTTQVEIETQPDPTTNTSTQNAGPSPRRTRGSSRSRPSPSPSAPASSAPAAVATTTPTAVLVTPAIITPTISPKTTVAVPAANPVHSSTAASLAASSPAVSTPIAGLTPVLPRLRGMVREQQYFDARLTPESRSSVQPEVLASAQSGESSRVAAARGRPIRGPSRLSATASQKKRAGKRKTAETDEPNDVTEDVEASAPASKRHRQSRPRKKRTRVTVDVDGQAGEGDAVERDEDTESQKRRRRSVTPEDAESQLIDRAALSMGDLTRDLHIGKKFSRHDELKERERERRRKKPRSTAAPDDEQQGDEAGRPTADGSQQPLPQTDNKDAATRPGLETPATAMSGPQFQVIDGQIVVDQSSLVVDRHAAAAAARAGQEMEEIEETDFTRLTTSASYRTSTCKLKGPNHWNAHETEEFYRGLSMFGANFMIISKLFPGRDYRHVKKKFDREDKKNPERVTAALVGPKTLKMDLAEFELKSGVRVEPMSRIMEELERSEAQLRDKFEAEMRHQQEEMQRKKDELMAGDEEEGEGGEEGEGESAQAQASRGRGRKRAPFRGRRRLAG